MKIKHDAEGPRTVHECEDCKVKNTAQNCMRNILTLMNLPDGYDPKNGIPKGAYAAVLEELKDYRSSILEEAAENVPCFQPTVKNCDCPGHRIAAHIRSLK
jgi:hypothetical protein